MIRDEAQPCDTRFERELREILNSVVFTGTVVPQYAVDWAERQPLAKANSVHRRPADTSLHCGDADVESFRNKLAGLVQFDWTFIGEEPGDRKSHIHEQSVREISPVVDLRG
jgi:hypothetical protein